MCHLPVRIMIPLERLWYGFLLKRTFFLVRDSRVTMATKMFLLLAVTVAVAVAFPAAENESSLDSTKTTDERSLTFYGIMDMLKQSLDRLVNKLVDDTRRNFPQLRQAIADFEKAVKEWRLHKLTHAAAMKTLIAFTKSLYQVREQMASVEKLQGVVRWMDERVKGICFMISLYHEDCGYPDVDTIGGW